MSESVPFNPSALLAHADYLVSQDETELALECLDLVPAYYRDHKLKEIEDFKSLILRQMLMPNELAKDQGEMPKDKISCLTTMYQTARGRILYSSIQDSNLKGITPHLVEFGPGDFSIPIALAETGMKFTYNANSFNEKALATAKVRLVNCFTEIPPTGDQPTWLIAYEIIEHLADISEIRQINDRQSKRPEKIFISTPKYTFHKGSPNWKQTAIHHRRAYTPMEFIIATQRLFPPDIKWEFFDADVMVVVGEIIK